MELYRSFLDIAVDDLRVSKLLSKNSNYPYSIYFLQQSVEKAVKAYGLITGAIEPNDCIGDISHKSHKVFRKLITSTRVSIEDYMKEEDLSGRALSLQNQLDIDFESYLKKVKKTEKKFQNFHENQFFDLSEEDLGEILDQIEENANISVSYDDSEIGEFLFQMPGSDEFMKVDDIPNGKDLIKEFIRVLENQLSTTYTLMYMSLLTFAHNQATRYPCLTCGGKPDEMYNQKLPLVTSYPKIINLYENALNQLAVLIQDLNYQERNS